MPLQLGALRDALLSANADPEKAAKAAEEVAGYDNRLSKIESDLNLLKWMVGGIYIIGLPTLWLLIRVAAKVGALGG